MRRSRKPVWAVPSIEGSNPSLSVPQAVFRDLCRYKERVRTVAAGVERGSTQASVGPTLRGFVPSPFPPHGGEFVHSMRRVEALAQLSEPLIRDQYGSSVGASSMLADRQLVIADYGGGESREEVVS